MDPSNLESEIEKYGAWCKENMSKKILEKKPNTFSILYRSSNAKPFPQGKFSDAISDYFRNRLVEGGIDITDELAIRTCPLAWSIYFEVYCGLIQIDGTTISTSDLFNRVDFAQQCEMQIVENVPMCLFDKFNIVNYPTWGEVVMFNHDKLKSDLLDKYMVGSIENMGKSYQEVLDIMDQFPNKYNILSEKIIDSNSERPIEIIREEDRILNLRNSADFVRLLHEKKAIELDEPNVDAEGVYVIENGKYVNGPNYDTWKIRRDEWVTTYKTWFKNIAQEYKLCFKACYENMMRGVYGYISRDFQFPGFVMHTNFSGNTIF